MALTLKQAAKEIGLSKPAVLKAIQKGRISAAKDEKGRWQIEPAELFRVYPKSNQVNRVNDNQLTIGNDKVNSGLQVEVEVLREKTKMQKDRIEELQEERDKWREQSSKLLITYENDKKANLEKIEQSKDKDSALIWLMPFLSVIIVGMALIILKSFNVI